MTNEKHGGPAFPQISHIDHNGNDSYSDVIYSGEGVTVRDYFAAAERLDDVSELSLITMEKILGRKMPLFSNDPLGWYRNEAEVRAIIRYIRADAILKAREVQS